MPEWRGAGPIALRQPAVVVGKEPHGCRGSVWAWGPRGVLAMLVGDTWSATVGMHGHDDADAVSLPPQLSGADPECSCDEGDETSRKKRSRNL